MNIDVQKFLRRMDVKSYFVYHIIEAYCVEFNRKHALGASCQADKLMKQEYYMFGENMMVNFFDSFTVKINGAFNTVIFRLVSANFVKLIDCLRNFSEAYDAKRPHEYCEHLEKLERFAEVVSSKGMDPLERLRLVLEKIAEEADIFNIYDGAGASAESGLIGSRHYLDELKKHLDRHLPTDDTRYEFAEGLYEILTRREVKK